MRQIVAIIPAAGIGSRMQADCPKQYLMLNGKTVLAHSVNLFLNHDHIQKIVIAINPEDPTPASLPFFSHPKIQWVKGGDTRAESVLNALQSIEDKAAWVLVHDAARPCLRWQEVEKLLEVEDENGAILATPVTDTLKKASAPLFEKTFTESPQIEKTVPRSNLWQAQTPQFFPAQTLKKAISQGLKDGLEITDEASSMEAIGFCPKLILGQRSNLKITYPEDLALAAFFLQQEDN